VVLVLRLILAQSAYPTPFAVQGNWFKGSPSEIFALHAFTRSLQMTTDPRFSPARSSNPPICVEAHRFVRKLCGGAQAHLIESADGSSYVVKFTSNPQHPRILINEWITSRVLQHLAISTPDTAIVNISSDFIRDNPEVHIQHSSRRAPPAVGPHFGSRFLGELGQLVVYSHLPDTILGSVANLSDFCGVLVADKWLGNTDSRQAIFIRVTGVRSPPSFVAQMIDNGQMFDGGNWRFEDSTLRGPYFGRVYQNVRDLEAFEPWLTAVAIFSETVLKEAFEQMPSAWRGGDTEAAFKTLVDQLLRRRPRVSDLIHACHAQPANPFPNWL
jgi:hypothetical protein